jgi:hypothetical protein
VHQNWPTVTANEDSYRIGGESQQSKCLSAMARRGEMANGQAAQASSSSLGTMAAWPTPNCMDVITPTRDLTQMESKGHWGKGMNTGKLSEMVNYGQAAPASSSSLGSRQGSSEPSQQNWQTFAHGTHNRGETPHRQVVRALVNGEKAKTQCLTVDQVFAEEIKRPANDHSPHAGHGEQRPERTLGDLSGGCGEAIGNAELRRCESRNVNREETEESGAGCDQLGNAQQFLLSTTREHGAMDETSGIPADGKGCEPSQADPIAGATRKREGDGGNASEFSETQQPMGGDADGPADRMDYAELCVSCDNRTDELRLLGNGVVPATAERAFRIYR